MTDETSPLSPLVLAVLTLAERGVAKKRIARQLKISRGKVLRILKNRGRRARRPQRLDGFDALVSELFLRAEGNVVLVHKWLREDHGIHVSYPTVHRRLELLRLLQVPKDVSHRFETGPGEEGQADTSDYNVELGGEPTKVILYTVLLGFSRYVFGRFHLRFRRVDMKRGTYAAFEDFGGSVEVMIIDNTSLAVHAGTGREAEIEQEMAEFARALGFVWIAHEVGHADRKGKEERFFYFVQTNFFPGRKFRDLHDLNEQFAAWLKEVNARVHGTTKERPVDRLALERAHFLPLPDHPIDLAEVVARKVTVEGFINFETNRYSVPARFVGKTAFVHADVDRLRIFIGPDLVATHPRVTAAGGRRITDPTHHPRPEHLHQQQRAQYIAELYARFQDGAELLTQILHHHPNHFTQARRVLEDLQDRFPRPALERAVRRALRFRAFDIKTVQRILEAEWLDLNGDHHEGNAE